MFVRLQRQISSFFLFLNLRLQMATDTFKRIAYLHQVQSLINDISEEKKQKEPATLASAAAKDDQAKNEPSSPKLPLVKLNAFFGFLSKEIAMKHNVQILNSDEMRQFRCKRCFAQYNFHAGNEGQLKRLCKKRTGANAATKSCLELTCPHCGFLRKVIFKVAFKTKYERVLAGLPPLNAEELKKGKKKKKRRMNKKKSRR